MWKINRWERRKNAEEFLDDTFLVISGDALTDIDLGKAVEYHYSKGSMATLVLKKVDIPLEYGVVVTENNKVFGKAKLGRSVQRYCKYRYLYTVS